MLNQKPNFKERFYTTSLFLLIRLIRLTEQIIMGILQILLFLPMIFVPKLFRSYRMLYAEEFRDTKKGTR